MRFIILALIIFVVVDSTLYGLAKYPERSQHWYSIFPGSGVIVIILHGRKQGKDSK